MFLWLESIYKIWWENEHIKNIGKKFQTFETNWFLTAWQKKGSKGKKFNKLQKLGFFHNMVFHVD